MFRCLGMFFPKYFTMSWLFRGPSWITDKRNSNKKLRESEVDFKVLIQVINFLFVVFATRWICEKNSITYVSSPHLMLTFCWSFSGLLRFLCTTFTFTSGNYSARGTFCLELSSFFSCFRRETTLHNTNEEFDYENCISFCLLILPHYQRRFIIRPWQFLKHGL